MRLTIRAKRNKLLVSLLFLILLFSSPLAQSIPSGVGDMANEGCLCHGAKSPSTSVIIDGIPSQWVANNSYEMSIIINSSIEISSEQNARLGGFRLMVNEGAVAFAENNRTQVIDEGQTHTSQGNQYRQWNFTWTAPSSNDSVVDFIVFGNAVNSNSQSTGDAWNYYSTTVAGEGYTGVIGESPDYSDEIQNSEIGLLLFAVISLVGLFYYSTK
jgi:hypothetical protein